MVARWAVASALAVALFSLTSHYNWLRLYNGSYLASCMLVAGLALLLLFRRQIASLRPRLRGIFAAVVLAFAFAMAVRAWVGFSLDLTLINATSFLRSFAGGFWLSTPRWLRLGPAILAVLPYFAAEELALGDPHLFRYWRRFGVCLLLRLELWLLMLLAVYFTMNGQVSDSVSWRRRFWCSPFCSGWVPMRYAIRTGSAAAGAVFGAILAGWFIASVFPLT